MNDYIPEEFENDPYALRYGTPYILKMQFLEEAMLYRETEKGILPF